MNQRNEHARARLSAREAAAYLGVKLPTLYAYASRGLVRSFPGERGRQRQYLRADLDRLRARRDARAGHGPLAAAALRFGEPVLDSSISWIGDRGPVYRGSAALDLAAADTPFESVAELLWSGTAPPAPGPPARWGAVRDFGLPGTALRGALAAPRLPPLAALAVLVPLLAGRDPGRFDPRPAAVLPRARVLVRRMAAALAFGVDPARADASFRAESVAAALATALDARGGERAVAAINRALVLCADHELNASAFAARVVASTGADVYACVSAALAALSGPRHGGAVDRIEALVREAGRAERAAEVVHERARRGEPVEGFGHPLYRHGDPRAEPLLALARELAPRDEGVATCLALVEAMSGEGRGAATVDVGLVALGAALGLRPGAAVGLFAVGRCAGWVAHVLEQYEAGYLVRPRARQPGGGGEV